MSGVVGADPLTVTLDFDGHQPSIAVVGRADYSSISSVVGVLDRLAKEHEHCVSLDLGGVESMDAGALEGLAGSACVFRDRRKRLHLKNASDAVLDLLDKHLLTDLFCVKSSQSWECNPRACGIAEAPWDIDVFTLPCLPDVCHEARTRVDRVAEAVGFAPCKRSDVMLAVGEAVANAVSYGQPVDEVGGFTVSCIATSEKLCVSVSDRGLGFCPENIPTLEDALVLEHGRGIHCMRAVMDEVDFYFGLGTTVRMVKLNV